MRPLVAAGCLLPAELGDLRRIEVLRLADNHFRGNVPMTMANLKACKELVSDSESTATDPSNRPPPRDPHRTHPHRPIPPTYSTHP